MDDELNEINLDDLVKFILLNLNKGWRSEIINL